MPSIDPIYEDLRKKMDESLPVGFPASEDGTELHLLEILFTPEEAKIALNLGVLPERLKVIHRRVKKAGIEISIDELEKLLNGLVEKGGIMGGPVLDDKERNLKNYCLAQWTVGIFDFQLDRMTKEFAELANKYTIGTFYKEFHPKDRPTQLRTIPIEQSLALEHHVGTYDNVREMLKKVEKITLRECVCRQQHDLMEEPCKLSDIRHCCFAFNDLAEMTIEDGSGKEISKQEFFDLLDEYQKEGFVLQPLNTQTPYTMCACCGCCCGVLLSAKQFPNPAEYYHSNYYAQSNPELCIACETCVNRCQMEAITIVNDKSKVSLDRCIGCGNCIATCEVSAMKLVKREEVVVPPKDAEELYQEILKKKMGIL